MGKSFWGGGKKSAPQVVYVPQPEPEAETLTPEQRKKRRTSRTVLSTDDDVETSKKQILGVG